MFISSVHYYILFFIFSFNTVANSGKCSDKGKIPLSGLIPPVFTPMDKSGQVNVSVVPAYAKYLKMKGLSGALVAGTSGEGPNLSVREKKKLFEAWVKAAKPLGLKVVAQIGGVPIPDIIELAVFAKKIQVDVILVLPTVYYKPKSPEDLTSLMEMVSEAAPSMPIMYYDNPDMSGVKVDMPTFFKMASEKVPQFIGLKAELEVVLRVMAATELRPDQGFGIAYYPLLLESVAMGLDTSFSTLGNVCPEMVMEVMNCTKSADMPCASKAQKELNKLSDKITAPGYVSALKAATEMVSGLELGDPRPPVPTVSEQDLLMIKAALEENGIKVQVNANLSL